MLRIATYALQILVTSSLFFCVQVSASTPEKLSGFDISHFNGKVDWNEVSKSKHHFVVLKATEGVDWLDPTFREHWQKAKESKLVRGAYHFFVAHDEPEQEAKWYIQNVKLEKGDLPPIVDVERAKKQYVGDLSTRLKVFNSFLEKHYQVKPIIYTGPNFWNSSIKEPFSDHHLWIADYGVERPVVPGDWKKWTLWQYTQEALLKGVEKPVDMNTFFGDEKEFQELLLLK